MIIIVTVAQDLHALTVQREVRAAGGPECHIIECDRIAQREAMSYAISYNGHDRVLTSEGIEVSLSRAALLWLRTVRSTQILEFQLDDDVARALVDNDCRGGLLGLLTTQFKGKWISTIEATYRGSDKIAQLAAAHACGFRVPRTLISQSLDDVREFYKACDGNLIVKSIIGAPGPLLETTRLSPDRFDSSSFAAAPAIYQEFVRGSEHLRLNCFGSISYAARIKTDDVDWRANLNVPVDSYPVPFHLHRQVRKVLDHLNLEMGIVDLKLTPEGDPVWLEVNPQGQFLFLDGLTDLNLGSKFAAYLIEEAGAAAGDGS